MTDKEKARAYDNALERAKLINPGTADYNVVINIFPEIKESEDEKMLNVAINACKYMVDNFENSTKQYEDCIAWLKNQREQNPADKVKSKFRVKYGGNEYNVFEVKDTAGVTFYGIEDSNHLYYVSPEDCEIVDDCGYGVKEKGSPYPTKSAMFSKQEACWSEEDENAVEVIMNIIKKSEIIDSIIYTKPLKEELFDWLKSIKERLKGE